MGRSAGLTERRAGWVLSATLATSLVLSLVSTSAVTAPRDSMPTAAGVQAAAAQDERRVDGPDAAGAAPVVTDFTSNNWDGYFATDASHTTDFSAISATWTVAPVTCGGTAKEWAGFWVGMDGWWNDIVEQGGTQAICVKGTPQYSVWWEMFPQNAIQTAFAVSPGDKVHASVTYDPDKQKFRIVVNDRTTGEKLTETTKCGRDQGGCPRTSAEVISENISHFNNGRLFPLPDYGTQTDLSVSVTDTSGHTGPLSDPAWQLGRVTQVSSGVAKQTTSDLSADGSSFTTSWQHE